MNNPNTAMSCLHDSEDLSNPDVNAEYVQKCDDIPCDKKQSELDVQCICCGAVLSEVFAIWFRNRYYCCKECLPEETSRGYRLV